MDLIEVEMNRRTKGRANEKADDNATGNSPVPYVTLSGGVKKFQSLLIDITHASSSRNGAAAAARKFSRKRDRERDALKKTARHLNGANRKYNDISTFFLCCCCCCRSRRFVFLLLLPCSADEARPV